MSGPTPASNSVGAWAAAGFGHAINGTVRGISFAANLSALTLLNEGLIRSFNVAKAVLIQGPITDVFTYSGTSSWVSRAVSLIRPFGQVVDYDSLTGPVYALSNRELLIGAAAATAASVVLTDLGRVVCGEPPAAYNMVLSKTNMVLSKTATGLFWLGHLAHMAFIDPPQLYYGDRKGVT